MIGVGLTVIPNSELIRREHELVNQKADDNALFDSKSVTSSLAGYARKLWDSAYAAKEPVQQRLLKCLRQRNGEYEPDKLAEIKQWGGSTIYVLLTNIKSRAAEAWIRDVLLPAGEKPWSVEPTEIPSLPPELDIQITQEVVQSYQQSIQTGMMIDPAMVREQIDQMSEKTTCELREKAKQLSEKMERKIEDDLTEGNFYQSLNRAISDYVTYPTAFIKGPVLRNRKRLSRQGPFGNSILKAENKLVKEYEVVSPFDIYPSAAAKSIQDGYLCHRHTITRAELQRYIGAPGYSEEAIRRVLQQESSGNLRNWLLSDTERSQAQARQYEQTDPVGKIDAVEIWADIPGKMLLEWGMPSEMVQDQDMDYPANVWLVGNEVVRAIINPDPLGKRPYHAASYDIVNDSVWGKSLPESISDIQDVCNAAARSLINNMAISSGPQVVVAKDRIPPGSTIGQIYPWRIWMMEDDPSGRAQKPVDFYQPNPLTSDLLAVFRHFYDLASEITGMPGYAAIGASDGKGAANTASGLSMLMNSASRVMRDVVRHIDIGIIVSAIEAHYVWVMLYDDDLDLKQCDLAVKARASEYLIMLEQLTVRRNEFLQLALNPAVLGIIGQEGLSEIIKESVRALKMPTNDIVPDREEITRRQLLQIDSVLQRVSDGTGIPAESLAALLQQQTQLPRSTGQVTQPQVPAQSPELDVNGQPMAGQDFALLQNAI